jgi:hypothetical protein
VKINMKHLAVIGAAARVSEIEAELTAIAKAFPGLKSAVNVRLKARKPRKVLKRKPLSAAAKAAISKRMKLYWQGRRKLAAD